MKHEQNEAKRAAREAKKKPKKSGPARKSARLVERADLEDELKRYSAEKGTELYDFICSRFCPRCGVYYDRAFDEHLQSCAPLQLEAETAERKPRSRAPRSLEEKLTELGEHCAA